MKLNQWLAQQPFTLAMSSGFFGFFAHAGVLDTLLKHSLKPAAVSGSSAGALIAGVYASGTPMEVMLERLFALRKADFWDPGIGLGLLKGRKFRAILTDLVHQPDLAQCTVPCSISIWDALSRQTRVLQNGSLVDIIYASCAVPLLFQPRWLDGRPSWDGGIADRPGLAGINGSERVFYHHIAARSPWRKRTSRALQIPQRADLMALAINGLPRSGPNRLHLGPTIFAAAKVATEQALRTEVHSAGDCVQIVAS
ncbi:MAG: patatin-like phospholipase family protein [Gammaproteobacteria bacterium]|nr:patatin-like phospholipase family protein [Gammaproteobacteria bacterium]